MKRLGWIWIMVLLVLVDCTSRSKQVPEPVVAEPSRSVEGQSHELATIDSLMWRQPDSALARLIPCFDTCMTTAFNRHYANLLLAELLYKNDYTQTNRPALQQAVVYFDSLVRVAPPFKGAGGIKKDLNPNPNLAFLDARAHYIHGVGYYENDSVVEACAEYLKALEVMECNFKEKELLAEKAKFMALTNTRLTNLYSNDYLQEQALYFGKISLKYYQKYNAEASHISWILNELGYIYDLMEKLDSADYYYKRAMYYLTDTISQVYKDIAVRQAFLDYKKSHRYEKSLTILHHFAHLATNEHEQLTRYLVIGDIYYYERQFDSAWFYLKQVYDNTPSPDSKLLAAERLQEISMANGDTLNAKAYALTLSQYVSEKDQDGKLHSVLTGLCQQYEQNKQEIQQRLKVQKIKRLWIIVLGIVMLAVAIVSLLLSLSRKHNKRLRIEKNNVDRLLETERYNHKMQQAALAGRLKRSNEELRGVSLQLEQTLANNTMSEPELSNDYTAFINAPICLYIVRLAQSQQFKSKMDYLVYKDVALNKKQILALRDAAKNHLGQFVEQIRKRFPNLTDNDMDYCYLFLLGMYEADISALMQRAYTTVCDRSRKIARIIEANDSLYQTLHNMLSK